MSKKKSLQKKSLWKVVLCLTLSVCLGFYAFQPKAIKAFAIDKNAANQQEQGQAAQQRQEQQQPQNIQDNGKWSEYGSRHYEYTDPNTKIKYVYDYPAGSKVTIYEKTVQETVKRQAAEKKWKDTKDAVSKAAASSIKQCTDGFFKAAMIDENGNFKFDAKTMINAAKDATLSFLSAGLEIMLGPFGGVAGSILTGAVNWMLNNLQNIGAQKCQPNADAFVTSKDTAVILDTMNVKIGALEKQLNTIEQKIDQIQQTLNNEKFSNLTNELFGQYDKINKYLTWKLFDHSTKEEMATYNQMFKGVSEYKLQFKTDANGELLVGEDGLYIVDEEKTQPVYSNYTNELTPSIILNTYSQYKKDVIDKKTEDKSGPAQIESEDNVDSLSTMGSKMLNFYNVNIFNNTDTSNRPEKWIFNYANILRDTKASLYFHSWNDGKSRILFNDYADLVYTTLVNNGIDRKTAAETTIDSCDALGLKFINSADLCTKLLDFYFTHEALNSIDDSSYDQKVYMNEIIGLKDAKDEKDMGINQLVAKRTDEIREKYNNIIKAKVTDVQFQGSTALPPTETYYESFGEAWKAASEKITTNTSGTHSITVTLLDNLNADMYNGFAKDSNEGNEATKGFINDGCLLVNSNKGPNCSLTLDLNGFNISTYENGDTSKKAWEKPIFCLDCPYGLDNNNKPSGNETCTSTFNLINSKFEASSFSTITSKKSVIMMRGRNGNPNQWTPINCNISGIRITGCDEGSTAINWLGGVITSKYDQEKHECIKKYYDNLSIRNCKFDNMKGGAINTFWYAHYNIQNTEFSNITSKGNGAAINSSCSTIDSYTDSSGTLKSTKKATYRVITKSDNDFKIKGSDDELKNTLNVNDPDYYKKIMDPECKLSYSAMDLDRDDCNQDVYAWEITWGTEALWNKYKTDMCNIINNCTFNNLKSRSYGGALALNTSTYLLNCTFDTCSSEGGKGGAIARIDEDFFTICSENCIFKNCKVNKNFNSGDGALTEGGIICGERINNEKTELPNESRIFDFEGRDIVNGKTDYGLVNYFLDRGYPTYGFLFKNCNFTSAEATNGRGGSIFSCGLSVKCDNCSFNNCKSNSDGAAIYITHPNKSTTNQDYGWEVPSCFFDCTFDKCNSEKGSGTLYFYDDSAIVGGVNNRTTITNCETCGDGSAIVMTGKKDNERYHWTNFKRNDLVLYNADIKNNKTKGKTTVFLNNTVGDRYNNEGENNHVMYNVNITDNITGGDSIMAGVYCEQWESLKTTRTGSRTVYSNLELGGVCNIYNNHKEGDNKMGGIYLAGNTSEHKWTWVLTGDKANYKQDKSKLPGMSSMILSDISNIIISTQYSSSRYDKYIGDGFNNNQLKIFKPYATENDMEFYLDDNQIMEKRKNAKKGK